MQLYVAPCVDNICTSYNSAHIPSVTLSGTHGQEGSSNTQQNTDSILTSRDFTRQDAVDSGLCVYWDLHVGLCWSVAKIIMVYIRLNNVNKFLSLNYIFKTIISYINTH